MYLVSFIIGLIVVISSIFLIRHELNKAVRQQAQLLEQSRLYKGADLFEMLENLQMSLDEMNRSFYEIADDLEGKYSIHEKEIQNISEYIESLKQSQSKIKQERLSVKEQLVNMSFKPEKLETIDNAVRDPIKQPDYIQPETKPLVENKPLFEGKAEKNQQQLVDTITLLRSQGLTLTQIAKELDMGLGEIQLLIALHK